MVMQRRGGAYPRTGWIWRVVRRALAAMVTLMIAGPALAFSVVSTNFESWVARNATLVIELDQPTPELRMTIGDLDVSALLQTDGNRVLLHPQGFRLPSGEHTVTLYASRPPDDWEQRDSLPLKVLTRGGFEAVEIRPSLEVGNQSQLKERTRGSNQPSQRPEYYDFTASGGVNGAAQRGDWFLRGDTRFVGFSHRPSALRFGELQTDAPHIDLASYYVEGGNQHANLALGDVSYGNHPLLLDNLSHRGMRINVNLPGDSELSLAALRGNSIVGYDKLLGVTSRDHRILGLSWAISPFDRDWLPSLELTVTDASVVPEDSFGIGEVRDAERSSGAGLRLGSNGIRHNYEFIFARSRFDNPVDPFLAPLDDTLVPVETVTENAMRANAGYRWPQLAQWGDNWTLSAGLEAQWERVDPLYRTVGAFVSPDQSAWGSQARINLGALGLQLGVRRSRDNIDDLRSVLTTRTEEDSASLQLPLNQIFPGVPHLPGLSGGWQRVHQFAGNRPDPELSGFTDPSHLPNQVNRSWNSNAQWSYSRGSFGLNYSNNYQDNRQPGRERADFHQVSFGANGNLRLRDNLSVGLNYSRNRNHDIENRLKRWNRGYGGNINWIATQNLSFSAGANQQQQDDSAGRQESENFSANAQASWNFTVRRFRHELPGQLFLRWGRQQSESKDNVFDFNSRGATWTVNSGFSLTLF